MFKTYIQEKYEIVFEESNSYDDAVKAVNRQEAYSVITINKNDFEYYRSPYNEKTEATVIRKAFDEMIGNDSYEELSNNQINTVELEEKSIDSNGYFTFATDKFSVYALVYQDVDSTGTVLTAPKTGDDWNPADAYLLLMMGCVILTAACRRRKSFKY